MSHVDAFFTYYQANIRIFTRISSGERFLIRVQPLFFFRGPVVASLARYKQLARRSRPIFRTHRLTQRNAVRIVDSARCYNRGIPGCIRRLEYVPRATTFLTLILFSNSTVMYHTAYTGAVLFATVYNSVERVVRNTISSGDSSTLYWLPEGAVFFNLELIPFCGAQYLCSAGMHGLLLRRFFFANRVLVRLRFSIRCILSLFVSATRGVCANRLARIKKYSTAGYTFRKNRYPIVRGVAMNPVDHPHGGGNGHKSKKANPRSIFGTTFMWKRTSTAKQLVSSKYFLLRY